MTHIENEIAKLKKTVYEMWNLTIFQLEKAQTAMLSFDKDVAKQITIIEKKVDAYELKLNMDCENILALFNPLAIDLRFVISVLKINYNLERIGDYANKIAEIVLSSESEFDKNLLDSTEILKMFDISHSMLCDSLEAFQYEKNSVARSILVIDEQLNKIKWSANKIIKDSISSSIKSEYSQNIEQHLNVLSVIRMLERVGDQTKDISEEIIFYLEAKILKHNKLDINLT